MVHLWRPGDKVNTKLARAGHGNCTSLNKADSAFLWTIRFKQSNHIYIRKRKLNDYQRLDKQTYKTVWRGSSSIVLKPRNARRAIMVDTRFQ